MDFVDDIHLEAADAGGILGVVEDFADVVDTGVAGRVDFEQIDKSPPVNLLTGTAYTTWCGGHAGFAVQAFGQNAGNGGFTDPACAGEQVRVV